MSLSNGSRGTAVQEMQRKLLSLGYSVGSTGADGIFGNNTRTAVVKFQTAMGLSSTGIADENTLSVLSAQSSATGVSVNPSAAMSETGSNTMLYVAIGAGAIVAALAYFKYLSPKRSK